MNAQFKIDGRRIVTDRLVLRAFEQNDLNDFFEYAKVDGVGQMAGWQPHENIAKTQEILNSFIENDKVFAICLKETGKVIGSLGIELYGMENKLTEFDGYKGREIVYVLSKEYWGMGIMPEAVNAIVKFLFEQLDFDFLLCGHYDFNTQSKRVQEKCGFKLYRKMVFDTRLGTKESEILNLLINDKKNITLNFSHPETLIYKQ